MTHALASASASSSHRTFSITTRTFSDPPASSSSASCSPIPSLNQSFATFSLSTRSYSFNQDPLVASILPAPSAPSLPPIFLAAPLSAAPSERLFSLTRRTFIQLPASSVSSSDTASPRPIASVAPSRRVILPSRPQGALRSLVPDEICYDPRVIASNSLPPKKARAPRAGNKLAPSPFRPHVPADRRVLLWTAPFCLTVEDRFRAAGIRSHLIAKIYQGLLRASTESTRESYGAGLLRYHQFCDEQGTPEHARLPADHLLLAAFYSAHIGQGSGKMLRNWMSGLRLWHLFNDAPWHGDESWMPSLKKAGDRAGVAFKRPPRGPVTKTHMRAFRASLDLATGFGAAAWANATSCFWGCRRLGELVIKSVSKFSIEHDTCRETRISFTVCDGLEVVAFHIVWTKTTTILGAECILTQTIGEDADLCPAWAFKNHLAVNDSPPPHTPLFAYKERGEWLPLTKDLFIKTSSAVYLAAHLDHVFGHSYRIGGSLELLLAGVEPEVIMKLGGWTSLCFLIYWRRLEQVLPQRIIAAWSDRMKNFASSNGLSLDTVELNLDSASS
ncbi:hypothetical protein C8R47DRAFT_533080 [Mycena vitilis]|nr:hypothetical protein C8R47DRAFT_533080 [Mycena vitilis]